jgi:small subunit ribosomal protein S20
MAHHLSAKKRIRTSLKANLRNRQYRSLLRTVLRKANEGDTPEVKRENFRAAISVLDKLVIKGIIRKNTASRRKSSLTRHADKSPAA